MTPVQRQRQRRAEAHPFLLVVVLHAIDGRASANGARASCTGAGWSELEFLSWNGAEGVTAGQGGGGVGIRREASAIAGAMVNSAIQWRVWELPRRVSAERVCP
jgi:hypothetical protein